MSVPLKMNHTHSNFLLLVLTSFYTSIIHVFFFVLIILQPERFITQSENRTTTCISMICCSLKLTESTGMRTVGSGTMKVIKRSNSLYFRLYLTFLPVVRTSQSVIDKSLLSSDLFWFTSPICHNALVSFRTETVCSEISVKSHKWWTNSPQSVRFHFYSPSR